MLTDDEAIAVVLGLTAAERAGLATEHAATASALAKVTRVLPKALAERLSGLLSTAQFTAPTQTAAPAGASTLLDLAAAARACRSVVVGYTAWDGTASEREVDVYGLVFHSGRWYVTAHDHTRDDVRTFRLDRIASVAPGGAEYEVPAGFDAPARVVAGIAAVGWAHEVAVVLRASLDEARERIPLSVGRLREHPDGVLLTTRAEHLDGMARMLAGLGWDVDVITPDALRDELRALADRLRAAATRPAPAAPDQGGGRQPG